MKTVFLIVFTLIVKSAIAENDTLQIQTSAVCEMCKETLEKELTFEKGIKSSRVDLKTNILTVIYNPEKTNPSDIRVAVTKIGYDADSLTADPKAHKRLPDCCKKGGEKM
jgi:cation transport ATPase